MGLQTSSDSTGELINRGYSCKQFSEAVALLNKYNIDVVTHIMVGLPGENFEDLKNTVSFVKSSLDKDIVDVDEIHDLVEKSLNWQNIQIF